MYKKLVRHDRHGRHRGRGVRQDLQARRHGHPDQPAADPRRGARHRLPDRAREVRRRSSRTSSRSRQTGRPVLVGTVSIEKSERLSALLKQRGIKHVVLNAKYHAQEAEIVAQAGRKGAVTIATNMAGRGTDILLGGNPEFMARQQCARRGGRRAAAEGRRRSSSTTTSSSTSSTSTLLSRAARGLGAHLQRTSSSSATPSTTRSSRSAACTSSAPSGTRRGASTTSCAAAPAARATPARRASTCRSKTT